MAASLIEFSAELGWCNEPSVCIVSFFADSKEELCDLMNVTFLTL